MKAYDRIFILYFGGGADNVPRDNAEDLVAKVATLGKQASTKVVELEEDTKSCTYDLSDCKGFAQGKVAVYVVGHGTDTSESVGGCTAKDMAKTIDTISNFKIARVTFVACHSGGNGNKQAPHRFVSDFWDHAKGFVEEVVGYTGTVRMYSTLVNNPNYQPETAVKVVWGAKEWWVRKGSIKKIVSRDHDEDANRRKVYFSSKGASSKGWIGKME